MFPRIRRSQSTSFNLDDTPESEFKRGGVRATAGPRLGWSQDLQRNNKYVGVKYHELFYFTGHETHTFFTLLFLL